MAGVQNHIKLARAHIKFTKIFLCLDSESDFDVVVERLMEASNTNARAKEVSSIHTRAQSTTATLS